MAACVRFDLEMITKEVEWNFFAEGETCFVFDCAQHPLILRVNKDYRNEKLPVLNGVSKDKTTISCQKASQFNRAIIKRLVPGKYLLDEETLLEIDEQLAMDLNVTLEKNRHKLRQQDTRVLVGSSGVLMRNMACYNNYSGSENTLIDLPSIMIEIKPKFGFVSSKMFVSPLFCPYKCTLCRFCMQKHVKAANGCNDYKMKILDGYCPQKLFSNKKADIQNAIEALFEQPNKNLKLFLDKTYMRDMDGEWAEQLKNLLVHVLHVDSNSSYYSDEIGKNGYKSCTFFDKPIELMNKFLACTTKCIGYESSLCDRKPPEDYLISPLHKCHRNTNFMLARKLLHPKRMGPFGVLGIIQKLQSVDLIGVERLYRSYTSLLSDETKSFLDDYESEEWRQIVDELVAGKSFKKVGDNCVRSIMLYLLSMVFRDCSIVINLKACDDPNCCSTSNQPSSLPIGPRCKVDSQDFPDLINLLVPQDQQTTQNRIHMHYDIKIIDCDPKTHRNIPYYFHMDKYIVRNYAYLKSPYRTEVPVNIRLFGPLIDIFYSPHLQVYVPKTICIDYVINLLVERQPSIRSTLSFCSVSLNYEYLLIGKDEPFDVIPGDEIGIIDLVGGG